MFSTFDGVLAADDGDKTGFLGNAHYGRVSNIISTSIFDSWAVSLAALVLCLVGG